METEIRYSIATAEQKRSVPNFHPHFRGRKATSPPPMYDSREKAVFHYRNYLAGVISLVTQ